MGIAEVRREIRVAMADNHLTEPEAKRVVDAAYRELTFEVATELRDLFDRVDTSPPPQFVGVGPAWSVERKPVTGTSDHMALTRLSYALQGANVPINQSQIGTQVAFATGFGAPKKHLAAAPDTSRLFELKAREGSSMPARWLDPSASPQLSATRQTSAFIDVESNEVYLRVRDTIDGEAPRDRWEGPYLMDELRGARNPMRVRLAAATSPAEPTLDADFARRAARWWLRDNRYLAQGLTSSPTPPAGALRERFMVGLSLGTTDSAIVADGDRSKFYVKRETGGTVPTTSYFGPFLTSSLDD